MDAARKIRVLKQAGMSTAWLAVHFDVSQANIYAIVQGRTWKEKRTNGTDAGLEASASHE